MSRIRVQQISGVGAPGSALMVQGGSIVPTALASTPARLPIGPTSSRPASVSVGSIRWNTDLDQLEYYDGSTWTTASGIENTRGALSAWQATRFQVYYRDLEYDIFFNGVDVAEGAISVSNTIVTLGATGNVFLSFRLNMRFLYLEGTNPQGLMVTALIQRVSDSYTIAYGSHSVGEYDIERLHVFVRTVYPATAGDQIRVRISGTSPSTTGSPTVEAITSRATHLTAFYLD